MSCIKSLSVIGLSGLLACGLASQADARMQQKRPPVPSWYLALAGSVNFVEDADLETDGAAVPVNGTLEFDEGYGISGAVGYRPRRTNSALDHFRFEAELALRDNELDQFVDNIGTTVLNDDIQVQTAMINMYVDLNLTRNWRPYFGAGLGTARFHVDSEGLGIDDEDTTFAYQGMLGLYYTPPDFPVAEFGVGYRYLGATDATFNSNQLGGTTDIEYESHSLEIGSRFYF